MSKQIEPDHGAPETTDVPGVASISVRPGTNAFRVSGFGMDARQARISAEGMARAKLHSEAPVYELITPAGKGRVRCELGYVANGGEGA
jgi:hypothetical protein